MTVFMTMIMPMIMTFCCHGERNGVCVCVCVWMSMRCELLWSVGALSGSIIFPWQILDLSSDFASRCTDRVPFPSWCCPKDATNQTETTQTDPSHLASLSRLEPNYTNFLQQLFPSSLASIRVVAHVLVCYRYLYICLLSLLQLVYSGYQPWTSLDFNFHFNDRSWSSFQCRLLCVSSFFQIRCWQMMRLLDHADHV